MNIDFTGQIREMKERNILHKPFPCFEGYALFTRNQEGQIVRMTFPNENTIKAYLNALGYDWGDEGKTEFTNFDSENRLLTVLPELKEVETIAADPQWDPDKAPAETKTKHESSRTMEDIPHCAVELREVDHQVTPVSNHPAHDEKLKASTTTSKKKLPPWMDKDKKEDKKDGKKSDKKGDKKGDKKEEGKDGKKLPPWLNKKKSKSKDYSDLYKKVSGEYDGPLKVGDKVKNINKKCTHYGSEGVIKKFNDIPGDKGTTIAYECTNVGKNWKEGDVLDKTPDQLEKKD